MTMQPFTVVSGSAAPFLRANVDTDVIIRIERLTSLTRDQLGPFALEAVRFRADGSEDPDSVFNQPKFHGAPFLLAGPNFGCGSSREGAVWALQGLGVRAVIAPSYGDIFYSNCFQNGVLPIRLPLAQVEALASQCADGAALTVDLEQQTIVALDGTPTQFAIDALRKEGLLHGLDDIGLTLKDEAVIRAWQARDRKSRSWAWPDGAFPSANQLPPDPADGPPPSGT
jgi:3-isopropylmalate/(R)-2-methylmalate dehydratase small subunit